MSGFRLSRALVLSVAVGALIAVGGQSGAAVNNPAAPLGADTSASARPAAGAPVWTQLTPETTPGTVFRSGMAYDPGDKRMILFGGYQGGGRSDGTWAWTGKTWRDIRNRVEPLDRTSMGMAYDPVRDAVIMYGGFQTSEPENDTWEFQDGKWTQLPMYDGSVLQHAMDFDPRLKQIIYFGGTYDGDYEDYTVTLTADDWVGLDPRHTPPGRTDAAIAYDPTRDALVMFGGFAPGDERYGDTWVWDGNDWQEQVLPRHPSARGGAMMTTFGRHVALFGGSARNGLAGNHLWILKRNTWERVDLAGAAPEPRYSGVFEWDSARREAVLYGGHGKTKDLGDTWVLRR